jgi:hypothetical protein
MDKNEGGGGLKTWAIFGGATGDGSFSYANRNYNTFSSYLNGFRRSSMVKADTNNPRIISDALFRGYADCLTNSDCGNGQCVDNICSNSRPTPSSSPRISSSAGDSTIRPSFQPSGSPQLVSQFVIFDDNTHRTSVTWSSTGSTFDFNRADSKAPEGSRVAWVSTTEWAGFGFFGPAHLDLVKAGYTKMEFWLLSSSAAKVEIEDSFHRKGYVTVASTKGVWKKITLNLSSFAEQNVALNDIFGTFLITITQRGEFRVDAIRYY